MNYKEKREKAEQRVLGVLGTVGDTTESRVLKSNLLTIPGPLVMTIDKLLELAIKSGEDLQSILEFCRVNGLMDGPISLRELTGSSVSVGIGRGMYAGFDWTDGTIGLYDDINCRISHYHIKTQIDYSSRLGLGVALYSAVYKLLMLAGIDFSFNLYRIWCKRGVLKRLADTASNAYPSALVKAFKMRVCRFIATDQVKKFCSISRNIADLDHRVSSYDIYKQVSEDGTSFYVVHPETLVCEHFTGYPCTDFSDEELKMFAQFVAFCKGMPIINFSGELGSKVSNINL